MERRWYVTAEGRPVNWATAVRDDRAQVDVHVVIDAGEGTPPWRVLWLPAGHPCSKAQVGYAEGSTADGRPPELRRPPPAVVKNGDPIPPAALRLIRSDPTVQ